MAPGTRSRTKTASQDEQVPQTSAGTGQDDLETHISSLATGVRSLKAEIAKLKRANDRLRAERAEAGGSVQPKRGRGTGVANATLRTQVKDLKAEVRKLEQRRDKDKARIRKLKAREAKREADELGEDAIEGGEDTAYNMRRLLRRFEDLMASNTLDGDKEECAICFQTLKGGDCSSLPCDHVFCASCLSQLERRPASEERSSPDLVFSCPSCRKPYTDRDAVSIEMTAHEQWDALLKVAARWARIDKRREVESSEEEAEEYFIDDAHPTEDEDVPKYKPTTPPHVDQPVDDEDEEDAEAAIPSRRLRRARPVESAPGSPAPNAINDDAVPPASRASSPLSSLEDETEPSGPAAPDNPPNTPPQTTAQLPPTPTSISRPALASTSMTTPASPSPEMRAPLYSETPRTAKRKKMEDLAAARATRPRLY